MYKRTDLEPKVLFIAVILGFFFVAPLGLAEDIPAQFLGSRSPVGAMFQSNLILDLTRQNINFPGELMLAANPVPVANYFCDVLKQVHLGGFKAQDVKVTGIIRHLYLGSLVIGMFYLFYRNCRTAEEDPDI